MSNSRRRVVQQIRDDAQRWADRAAMHEQAGDHDRAATARYGQHVHTTTADRLAAKNGVDEQQVISCDDNCC